MKKFLVLAIVLLCTCGSSAQVTTQHRSSPIPITTACGLIHSVNVSSFVNSTTEVLAAPVTASQAISFCTMNAQSIGAPTSGATLTLSTGTGTNCATGNQVLKSFSILPGVSFTSTESSQNVFLSTPSGSELCASISGNIGVSLSLVFNYEYK